MELSRHSLEALHVQVLLCPGLCRLAPDLRGRVKPCLVVERPGPDESNVGHDIDLNEYRRSAVGAEMPIYRFAAGSLAFEDSCLALHFQHRTRYGDDDGKGASRLPLAIVAVAYRGHDRFSLGGIPDVAAEAAA